jgi:hypothetical protein
VLVVERAGEHALHEVRGGADMSVLLIGFRRKVRAEIPPPPTVAAPTIVSFSPSTGPVGTLIGIVGTNFVSGATSVAFNGVSALSVTVASTGFLTVLVPSGATTGLITVSTAGGSVNSATNYTVGAVSATRFLSRTNPNTGVTTNVEYARGVTSTYDVRIDEATGALDANSILWNWPAERVGAARHAAIPGGNRITVTTTGTTGWSDFVAARNTAAAGTGDWEIIVPTSAPLQQDGEYELNFPNGRRLYITAATLQTADVMPSRAGAFATFQGATFSRAKIWGISSNGTNITCTGIRWRCMAEVAFAMLACTPDGTVTGLANYAQQIVLDRCQFDGNGRNDVRRGIIGNVNQMAMLETEVLDISANFENAGFGCWSGARFCYFRNVNLEASGIGFLPGGAAPALPNTGTLDPRDFFFYRCAATKRDNWMPPTSGTFSAGQGKDGIVRTVKNNWETKNIQRCTFFECLAVRSRDDAGQAFPVIMKNSDQDSDNLIGTATQDIAILRMDLLDMPNGFQALGRGLGTEASPLTRMAFVDIRMRGLGNNGTAPTTIVWSMQSDIDDLIIDRITALPNKALGYPYPSFNSGGASSRLWMANCVVPSGLGILVGPGGSATSDGTEGFRTVWAEGANSYVGATVFYGPDALFNRATRYPSTTEYTSAASAGINISTGALSGDILTRGVGGSVPGASIAALDVVVAAMPWAYNR